MASFARQERSHDANQEDRQQNTQEPQESRSDRLAGPHGLTKEELGELLALVNEFRMAEERLGNLAAGLFERFRTRLLLNGRTFNEWFARRTTLQRE